MLRYSPPTAFSEFLRNARRSLPLTSTALAERLGVSRVSVSMWEHAHAIPHVRNLKRIAELFKVDPAFITDLYNQAKASKGSAIREDAPR
jgi:transcriptional regulator with XRE-family HTH domain